MRKIYIIGVAALLFGACRPSVNVQKPATPGSADFSNYLAIGNSLTAGYMDGSLTVSGQLNSYPERLFEQFSLIGGAKGAKGPFIQPLLHSDNGYPGPKKVLGMTYSICNHNDSSLAPINFPNFLLDPIDSQKYISPANNGQINNIGVPGIRVVDYRVANWALLAKAAGAPYAYRFYHDPTARPLDELAFRVHNLYPTFFTMWLGANDVLLYALNGGQGDGTGNALPVSAPYLYNVNDISPYNAFDTSYDLALNAAIATGASGALINIPDITTVPFFTTIPANGLVLARQGQADTLQAIWGTVVKKVFQTGANYFIIVDHNNVVRQAVPGELILLTCPADSIKCAGWGATTPIPAKYVLTTDEIQFIRNATTAYNSFIQFEATRHHLAYVDMNAFLGTLFTGMAFNGIHYNAQFVMGGAFSLDGIHLTQRGYALVANEIIRTINSFYGSTIPSIDANKYHGVDFP